MTNKEILANAPEGATHFIVQPINIVYLRFSGFIEGQLYCNHKKGWRLATHVYYSNMRSLSDIKTIVDLKAENKHLQERINKIAIVECSDYPNVKDENAFSQLWAIEQTMKGIMQANEDVHEEWEKSKAEIADLKRIIQNQNMRIYEHNSALVGAPVNKIKEQSE